MGKTDKTRPQWVKALDKPAHLEETHDHRDGQPCDLPSKRIHWSAPNVPDTKCYWEYTADFWCDRANDGCGCARCSSQQERKADIKKSRMNARRIVGGEWDN